MNDRVSVLFETEGTYPYVGGGVSTWCKILVDEIPEVDYLIFAVTGTPQVKTKYPVDKPNIKRIIQVPMWGAEEPAEWILPFRAPPHIPFSELFLRKKATTEEVIREKFVPLFRHFLRGFEEPEADVLLYGPTVWAIFRYFQEYDYNVTMKSKPVWEAFKDEMLRPYRDHPERFRPDEYPSVFDLTTCLRWFYNMLMVFTSPVPETDVTHATIAAACGLASIYAKFEYGTPFIITDHGVYARERYIAVSATDFTFFSKRFLINLAIFLSKLNYVFADQLSPCANFNQRWEIPFGGDPRRVRTIYNGVDPNVFVPGPKPEEFKNYPTAVAAARVFPLKDIETMIRGVAVAREHIPNLKVIVYGSLKADPPYVAKCRALVRELGLGPGEGDETGDIGAEDIESWTFRFGGFHSQPSKIFTTGDISLLSSISEGFPFTVLESMSCGTPVVGTDVGGVREALEGHGVVVPPRDPQAFGEGIVQLLSNDDLRQQLSRKCRETILAKFTTATSVDGYRESYEKWAAYKREHLDRIRAENARLIAAWEEEIEKIRAESASLTPAEERDLLRVDGRPLKRATEVVRRMAREWERLLLPPEEPADGTAPADGHRALGEEEGQRKVWHIPPPSAAAGEATAHRVSASAPTVGTGVQADAIPTDGGTSPRDAREGTVVALASEWDDSHSQEAMPPPKIELPAGVELPENPAYTPDPEIVDPDPLDEEKEKLVDFILETVESPVDFWAVAATLESRGMRDVDAEEKFNVKPLVRWVEPTSGYVVKGTIMVLAKEIYTRCRKRLQTMPPKKVEIPELVWWRKLQRFLTFYLRGTLFALPMVGQIIAVLALRYSLWAYLEFSEERATVVAIGTIMSFIVTGGFVQAIGRKGMSYSEAGQHILAKQVCYGLIKLGTGLVLAVGLAFYVLNLIIPFFTQEMVWISLMYYFLLSELWLFISILYVLTRRLAILLSTLAGVAIVHLVMNYTDWGIHAAHGLGLLGTNLIVAAYGYRLLDKAARSVTGDLKDARLPAWSILYYSLRLYFLYGMFYFGYLYLDRLIGWSASEQPLPYIIWFRTPYELGMDWALISLIFSIAVLEYTINEFASIIIPTQKRFNAFDIEGHNRHFTRFYLRQLVLLIVVAIASIIATYYAVTWLRRFEEIKLVRDFFKNPITFFVYWAAAVGYNLMVVGLFNGVFFFSLSRPIPALRAIAPATLVNAVIGFVLSRTLGYPYSAVGMAIGSLVFAVLATRYALRVMRELDYFYYSAY